MREIEASGHFWLLDKQKEAFEGVLTFSSENGGKVKTISHRFPKDNPQDNSIFGTTSEHPKINGFVNGVGEITLINCKTYLGMGFYSDSLTFQYAVIGTKFEDSEPLFDNISFSLSHLPSWFMGESTVQVKYLNSREHNIANKVEVSAEPKSQIRYSFENFDIAFYIGTSSQLSPIGIDLQTIARVKITLQESVDIDKLFQDYLYPFKLFMEFATDRPNYFLNVESKFNKGEHHSNLEILFKERKLNNLYSEKDIQTQHDLVFTFSDIGNNFTDVYELWLMKRKRIGSVIDLYLIATQSRLLLSVILQFLSQALESYHREMYGGQYMTDSEYEVVFNKLIKALPDSVGNDFRQSLKTGTLKYANEYSQRTRFKKVLKDVLSPISGFIDNLTGGDRKTFVTDIVNLRNYYTHLGADNKAKVETIINDPRKFQTYLAKMSNILLACLLLEFGFPPDKVEELLTRNHIRSNSI